MKLLLNFGLADKTLNVETALWLIKKTNVLIKITIFVTTTQENNNLLI